MTKPEDVLKRIAIARKVSDAGAKERAKQASASMAGRIQHDVSWLHVFLLQVGQALFWIYQKFLRPITSRLWRLAGWLFTWYRRIWRRWTYYTNEYGVQRFSKIRGGLMIIATVVALHYVPHTLFFMWQAGLYTVTSNVNETVYLTNSQEIDPVENVHSVQGCHSLPCTDDNSVYFRIRATYFHEVWSLLNGHGFFFPDYVAAAVPIGASKCVITAYGIRVKLFMRAGNIYPDLLAISCQPLVRDGVQ
jgi:hypothetical protein